MTHLEQVVYDPTSPNDRAQLMAITDGWIADGTDFAGEAGFQIQRLIADVGLERELAEAREALEAIEEWASDPEWGDDRDRLLGCLDVARTVLARKEPTN